MSRRPLAPFEIQENVAIDRMVAGGRRWSESPIARPGWRRPRMRGPIEEPIPPTFVQVDNKIPNSLTTWDLNDPFYSPDPMTDYVICHTFSDQVIIPPSGWTTLESGSVGPINYWLGWTAVDGSTDWTLSWGAPTTSVFSHVVTSWWDGGNLTPQSAAPVEASATPVAALPTVDPGWAGHIQAMFMNKSNDGYTYYRYGPYNATLQVYSYTRDQYIGSPWGDAALTGNVTFFSDSGRTIPKNIDHYVGLAYGWA